MTKSEQKVFDAAIELLASLRYEEELRSYVVISNVTVGNLRRALMEYDHDHAQQVPKAE